MSNLIIYGLIDPTTGFLRYIGKSVQGSKRIREHSKSSSLKNDGPTYKANWIRKLISQGLTYNYIILDRANNIQELSEKEIYWINHFKSQGYDKLTNLQNGGEGSPGRVLRLESRQKMSESARKRGTAHLIEYHKKLKDIKKQLSKEKIKKSFYNYGKRKGFKILATHISGYQISFFGMRSAEKFLSGTSNKTAIRIAINKKRIYKDFYWEML